MKRRKHLITAKCGINERGAASIELTLPGCNATLEELQQMALTLSNMLSRELKMQGSPWVLWPIDVETMRPMKQTIPDSNQSPPQEATNGK